MSTYRKHDEDYRHDVAEFLGDQFVEARRACGDTVREHPQLRYLAHYSQGIWDFSYGAPEIPLQRQSAMQRLGRRLAFTISALDHRLQEVRTGALIRTVLHTQEGAVVCESVVPRQNVVGVCFDASAVREPGQSLADAPQVRAADIALSKLTTQMRQRISLPSLNPGGWASANEVTPDASVALVTEPHAEVVPESIDKWIAEACVAAVEPKALQFVAYCAGGRVLAHADQFEHLSLAPYFTQIAVQARRRFYLTFSQEFGQLAAQLNHTLANGGPGGLLVRLVLDVEQGAIYFYRLDVGTYLVGVTIDQSKVRPADERLGRLALHISSRQRS